MIEYSYQVLLHRAALDKCNRYLQELKSGAVAGQRLASALASLEENSLEPAQLLELLINTKQPQIFAEMAVRGDGSDWNQRELSILGDVSFAVPVTVYDDGKHHRRSNGKVDTPGY